jgi:hypothetical protein
MFGDAWAHYTKKAWLLHSSGRGKYGRLAFVLMENSDNWRQLNEECNKLSFLFFNVVFFIV